MMRKNFRVLAPTECATFVPLACLAPGLLFSILSICLGWNAWMMSCAFGFVLLGSDLIGNTLLCSESMKIRQFLFALSLSVSLRLLMYWAMYKILLNMDPAMGSNLLWPLSLGYILPFIPLCYKKWKASC